MYNNLYILYKKTKQISHFNQLETTLPLFYFV